MSRPRSWKIVNDHLIAELLRLNRPLEDFRARGRRVSMFHEPKVKVVKLIPIESLYNLAVYFVSLALYHRCVRLIILVEENLFSDFDFDRYNCGKKYLTRTFYVSRSMLKG